jgi:hypothetical protein
LLPSVWRVSYELLLISLACLARLGVRGIAMLLTVCACVRVCVCVSVCECA